MTEQAGGAQSTPPAATVKDGLLHAASTKPWEGGVTFSLADRIYRTLFRITWAVLAAWTPPPLMRWRLFLLRCFGANVHRTARIYGSARIWSPRNLQVDAHATIGPGVNVYSMATIRLAPFCIVSQGAQLCTGSHDVEDPNFQLVRRPILIGERAWIAADSFVGPGVTVGEGAVLGAFSCAMKDLEPWTIYRGNPATAVRPRHVRF